MPTQKLSSKNPKHLKTKHSSVRKAKRTALLNGLRNFSMHSLDKADAGMLAKLKKERIGHPAFAARVAPSLNVLDPETAAKRYLNQALASKSVPQLTAPKAGAVESEFKSLGVETVPLTGTTTVKFRQTYSGIPVYGSLVTVELDDKNELVSLNSSLGEPPSISPIAKISPQEALKIVADNREYQTKFDDVVPKLHYYFDRNTSKWRLVFILEDVTITPKKTRSSNTSLAPKYMDYVVDAHTGTIVAQLPRTPSLASATETAIDGKNQKRQITIESNRKNKLLKNTQLNIQTFDFRFSDPIDKESSLPGRGVNNPPVPWPPAAVSAHANAAAVAEFLRTVLRRNNIDGKGGPMNSSINCVVASESSDGREWLNAFWNGQQMVYGQKNNPGGLLSLSVDLDVVGHEMFHGVTDSTARLEYAQQSGALNESYSDILGVIIANFSVKDIKKWNWNIGEGMDQGGKPFRNMEDPKLFGQPDHMKNFKVLPNTRNGDNGGVHTNSGIHNKAAFMILTASSSGKPVFTPAEVAAVFYIALTQHLSRTSQFSDSRRAVVLAAQTLFRAQSAGQQKIKLNAINKAFDKVGIKE